MPSHTLLSWDVGTRHGGTAHFRTGTVLLARRVTPKLRPWKTVGGAESVYLVIVLLYIKTCLGDITVELDRGSHMATRKLGVTCSGPVAGRAAPAADSHEERSSVCAGVLLDSSQAGILETGYRNTHGLSMRGKHSSRRPSWSWNWKHFIS